MKTKYVLALLFLAGCIKAVVAQPVPQLAAMETLDLRVSFYGLRSGDAALWVCGLDGADGGMSCVDRQTFEARARREVAAPSY